MAALLIACLCFDVLRVARLSGRLRPGDTAARLLPGLDHPRGATPVKYSDEIRSPLTWGSLRSQILVPGDARAWHVEELLMALQHELAHVQRMDWAGHLLARCVHAVHWPLPAMRLLLRQSSLSASRPAMTGCWPPAPESPQVRIFGKAHGAPAGICIAARVVNCNLIPKSGPELRGAPCQHLYRNYRNPSRTPTSTDPMCPSVR
ncbi:MAG: hypothetical protein HRT77_13825 [Halioglobus sp.]|nr:hypothetical protein [Halioglobus sp.]